MNLVAQTYTQSRAGTLAKIRRKRPLRTASEPLVNEWAARQGDYRDSEFVENDGQQRRVVKVKLNRGGTAIERWLADPDCPLFGSHERAAVKYVQGLWATLDGHSVSLARVKVDGGEGRREHEAMAELFTLKKHFGIESWWSVFENCIRFDIPAGTAGSHLATNNRTATERAKMICAFVAAKVAEWRRL